jgi:hypothetical protein
LTVASDPGYRGTERYDRPGGSGLEGVLRALTALHPAVLAGPGAPSSCTWVCRVVVGHVQERRGCAGEPDLEFEAVLVRRLADRYLRVVADAAAGRPVARSWEPLLALPSASPARIALAGVGTLLHYDLTLAFAGACTVLGRDPGPEERAAHTRVATVLGTCVRELVRRAGGSAETAAAGRLDSPQTRTAALRRAEHLWVLRGCPAEAEEERDALDREVRVDVGRLLTGPYR